MLLPESLMRQLYTVARTPLTLRSLRALSHSTTEMAGLGFRLLVPRSGLRVRVHGFAGFVANPCTAILLGPEDRMDREPIVNHCRSDIYRGESSWAVDQVVIPPSQMLRLLGDKALATLRCGRFEQPCIRLSAVHYIALRQLALEAGAPDARADALAWWTGTVFAQARSDWRRRPIPAQIAASASHRGRFELAQEMAAYLDARWTQPVSLGQLSEAFGLSPFYLLREFRRGHGQTPHRYLLQLRLRRSLDLIEAQHERILDIALRLGFSSHSHFSSAFRKTFGISPASFGARHDQDQSMLLPGAA